MGKTIKTKLLIIMHNTNFLNVCASGTFDFLIQYITKYSTVTVNMSVTIKGFCFYVIQ